MDQDFERRAKNVAVRPGIVFMEHPEIIGGLIRFGGKRYRIDRDNHPVEVTECGCEVGTGDSGDCQCCDTQISRCCP